MQRILLALIKLYQQTLSPDTGFFALYFPYGCCRFTPTCSHFAADAIRRHGTTRGIILTLSRLARCHPWHQGGFDPVR